MFRQSAKVLPQGVPDCLKKRHLLNEKELSPELCREYGEKFLALDYWEDALEFFKLGNYEPGLDKLKALALETGDAFLMARLGAHSPEVWRQVAEQALKLGKIHFARRAFEQAGDTERVEELAGSSKRDSLISSQ
ncbi:MAG: hypothetical protein P8X65_01635 [Syntrophobacterales bacterium]|jgi:hypothetical protein